MKQYRRLQQFIACMMIFYMVTGFTTWFLWRIEMFPIYSWDLFSYVPTGERYDYGVRLLAVGDEILSPSIYYEAADEWFADAGSIVAYQRIQRLGTAVHNKNETAVAEAQRVFESAHLVGVGEVQYEIVYRHYDMLTRWRDGSFTNEYSLRVVDFAGVKP